MPHRRERVPDLIDRPRVGRPPRRRPPRRSTTRPPSAASAIRDLAWTAAFATDEATIAAAQWLVWEAGRALGAHSASIQELYVARARGEVHGFTVPAINLRAQTFDMARTVYEAAAAADVGAVILELARSEQTYTFQRPIDYATAVLAGAIAAGWRGPGLHPGRPLPVQREEVRSRPRGDDRGDPAGLPPRHRGRLSQHRHRQLDPGRPVEAEPSTSSSTRTTVRAAELTALIRIARDRRRDGQRRRRDRRGRQAELERGGAASPTSTATAASSTRGRRARSGSPRSASRPARRMAASRCPDGSVAEVKLDFEVLRGSASVAREYGLAGAVQHGASTLPDELFHRFPAVETAEIHLATGFQNALYEHPAFPAELHREIEAWCYANAARRAQAGPDRPAVRLHDAQEGDRAVQAPALGPRHEGRDPRRAAAEDRLPLHRARRERLARDGRPVHPSRSSSARRCPTAFVRRRPAPRPERAERQQRARPASPPACASGAARPRGTRRRSGASTTPRSTIRRSPHSSRRSGRSHLVDAGAGPRRGPARRARQPDRRPRA